MAFFGPGVTLNTKPRWRQKWWWREKLPGIISVSVVVVLAVAVFWVVYVITEPDDSDAGPTGSTGSQRPTAQPSGTPKPTERPPQLPDEARERSEAGVEATIRFEIDAINYAQRTGDLGPARSIYNSSCEFCEVLLKRLSNRFDVGATYVGAEYTAISIDVRNTPGNAGGFDVYANVLKKQNSDPKIVDKNGEEIGSYDPMPETSFTYQVLFSDRWIIQEIS